MYKKMMRTLFILACAAVAAAAQAPDAPAADQRLMMRPRSEAKMKTRLNLSAEQEKRMQEMRLKHKKEMLTLRTEAKLKELDLEEELQSEKPNQARIDALVDQTSKVRAEMRKKTIANRLALRTLLTPEQQKIMDENRHRMPRNLMRARHTRDRDGEAPRPPRGTF